MPNDPAGQFPSPAEPASPTPLAVAPREMSLTDEVAPDLSAPAAPTETKPEPTPIPTNPAPIPAAFVPNHPFPLVSLLLLLVSIGAVAAAYFFYQQTRALGRQLTEIQQTLDQQRIKENQVTPTPTPLPNIEPSPAATVSAIPTSTPSVAPGSAFGQISSVIATARAKYPNAVLLMITAAGVENPATATIKYWFRQSETDKRYFYILSQPGKDLALVDQQVYITPDDNIPPLNTLAENGQLGLDLPEAVAIATAICPPNFSCNFTPITAQYIKAGTTLWQISYKPADGSKPFVIQIDSLTKKILYQNQ